ncbi:hypothetical protein [uncultured Methanobrevibacter sp.]|uniref:hypothetical protein n=1 Tax=uncultured Methanobrevibacter sp. TaxID=253161 RepID=UPI0025ED38DA|nr:hypothetical protein [uncultured Methanobrevibacter sp.]
MALVGTTIFSHILPVICGFFGIIMIISGSLENNKIKLGLGVVLFIIACVFPYLILSVLV